MMDVGSRILYCRSSQTVSGATSTRIFFLVEEEDPEVSL
jgi:hypothetical protein